MVPESSSGKTVPSSRLERPQATTATEAMTTATAATDRANPERENRGSADTEDLFRRAGQDAK
jgi:hypothetical protein